MGAGDRALTLRASTRSELVNALATAGDARQLVLIEAVLPRLDVPELLAAVSRAIAAADSPVS
jgi:TPP-dependent 2-oxoacid decarboxylase